MADTAHSLLVKYGLSNTPSEEKIKLWVEKTDSYISTGITAEEAGVKAAQAIFPDYRSMVYASQADTILALLAQARGK